MLQTSKPISNGNGCKPNQRALQCNSELGQAEDKARQEKAAQQKCCSKIRRDEQFDKKSRQVTSEKVGLGAQKTTRNTENLVQGLH